MAKSDTPLQEIVLDRAYTPPRKPAFSGDKPINGFDTETADGKVFALSFAYDGFGGAVEESKEYLQPSQILDKITNRQCRSAINVWYNLDFDANVILASILDKEQLAEVNTLNTTQTKNFEITYVKGKFLSMKDQNGNSYTHYDVSQFFYGRLENAVNQWLGETKANDGIDTKKFGDADGHVNSYIDNRYDKIAKYARKDAVLVRDLWKKAVEVGEDLGVPMGKPYSTGYLGESYLNAQLNWKPGIGPRPMAKLAWDCYHGGRFEVFKRGKTGPVVGPDVNSAYPYIISNLPDPATLQWAKIDNPTVEELRQYDYGFIDGVVSTNKNRTIQPFAYKVDDKLKYPILIDKPVQTLKEIFTHAVDNNLVTDYTLNTAWVATEVSDTRYPFEFLKPMYETRKDFESKERQGDYNPLAGQWLKIILNSIYGKTCQTTPKRERLEGEITLEKFQHFISPLSLPKLIRGAYEEGIIEWLEAGAWFNPFIASYITGLTRLELHKRVLEYGLEEDTVMFATDSIMVERKPFEESGFDELVKEGLGNWDYDYYGKDSFVIGAGIYEVELDNGKFKTMTRGFKEAQLDGTLTKTAQQSGEELSVESTRPNTLGEIVWHNEPISDIGKFEKRERGLRADFDDKRVWPNAKTYEKLLSEKQESKPIVLSE